MATRKVEQVLNGLKNLTPVERVELAALLSGPTPSGGPGVALERLTESFNKANAVHTAPINQGGCACCGK